MDLKTNSDMEKSVCTLPQGCLGRSIAGLFLTDFLYYTIATTLSAPIQITFFLEPRETTYEMPHGKEGLERSRRMDQLIAGEDIYSPLKRQELIIGENETASCVFACGT